MSQSPCPFCKEEIDNDSVFCDQCGSELLCCSSCGSFCKGNFCPRCGKPSVKVSEKNSEALRDETPDIQAQPSKLVSKELGIVLPLKTGVVIGRISGDYANLLGGCKYLSGIHARVDFDGKGWTLTDLGSRNGTILNGKALGVEPLKLSLGDKVQFARSYNFIVE